MVRWTSRRELFYRGARVVTHIERDIWDWLYLLPLQFTKGRPRTPNDAPLVPYDQ